MEIRTDEKYLKKLSDAADSTQLYYEAQEKEEDGYLAKKDWMTIMNYFSYLGVKAIGDGDEGLAEELQEKFKELWKSAITLRPYIHFLGHMLSVARRYKFPSDGEDAKEKFENEFDEMMDRIDFDETAEVKQELVEYREALKEKREEDEEEKLANQMYG